MGADLVATWAAWPKMPDGSYVEDIEALALNRIERLDEADFALVEEDLTGENVLNDEESSEEDSTKAIKGLREMFREAAKTLFGGYPARGFVLGNLRGQRFILAGGMSWGDEPSEAYSALSMLNSLGVLDDVEAYEVPPSAGIKPSDLQPVIDQAVAALSGDSNDAEHDALYELLSAIDPDAINRIEYDD